MKQRLLFFFFFVCLLLLAFNHFTQRWQTAIALDPSPQVYKHKVLLLPLDSRPPCQKFVKDAGRIADIEVITPPPEILDYYTQSGNTAALRLWLAENIKDADAAIISIDQLIHGGLLAAREADATPLEEMAALQFLTELHQANPQVPLYAFNILPRIHPTASIDGYEDRKALIKYSRLTEQLAVFDNELDLKELRRLEEKLPPAILEKYKSLYRKNTQLNEQLSRLTAQGIIEKLIIGQDDSEDFGIPNLEKQAIQGYLLAQDIPADKVFLTRGADEVALTLLTEIHDRRFTTWQPKIYVEYNDEASAGTMMPYMSGSVATTVQEKIRLVHGELVGSPDAADFTLFVHIGTDKNLGSRTKSANRLQQLLRQDAKIALVDLSQHFAAEETLFPILLNRAVPVNRLIAYAGWNTTSNAVGTAVAQATLFTSELAGRRTKDSILSLYRNNLTFLNNRYMEDYFYLKELIDPVNQNLKKAGYANVYDLDMAHNYKWANYLLQTGLQKRADYLQQRKAYRQPVPIATPSGIDWVRVSQLQIDTAYPWPRTFEIYMQTTLFLEELP